MVIDTPAHPGRLGSPASATKGADMPEPVLTNGFVGLLGLKFTEITADRVVIEWQVTPDLHQPYGILHGGVHCAVVETAASVAGQTWLGDRGNVVGVSNQTDFLRAVRDGKLTAIATPVHRGRLQQLWLVEITDEQGRPVARGQVRLQNIEDSGRLAAGTSS
jgi:1,4-dihydroxy-2-naphthoyl-CoA hydrolase